MKCDQLTLQQSYNIKLNQQCPPYQKRGKRVLRPNNSFKTNSNTNNKSIYSESTACFQQYQLRRSSYTLSQKYKQQVFSKFLTQYPSVPTFKTHSFNLSDDQGSSGRGIQEEGGHRAQKSDKKRIQVLEDPGQRTYSYDSYYSGNRGRQRDFERGQRGGRRQGQGRGRGQGRGGQKHNLWIQKELTDYELLMEQVAGNATGVQISFLGTGSSVPFSQQMFNQSLLSTDQVLKASNEVSVSTDSDKVNFQNRQQDTQVNAHGLRHNKEINSYQSDSQVGTQYNQQYKLQQVGFNNGEAQNIQKPDSSLEDSKYVCNMQHSTSIVVRITKEQWIFNCGEDIQRQLFRMSHISIPKVTRIFITQCIPENTSGLSAVLLMIAHSIVRGHQKHDLPVHIYGPPGVSEFLVHTLHWSDTVINMPILVHELMFAAVEDNLQDVPRQITQRSNIFQIQIPPDQLNRYGWYDGNLKLHTLQQRGSVIGQRDLLFNLDPRSVFKPLQLPPQGDPSQKVALWDMKWTILCDEEVKVECIPIKGSVPTFAYVITEADRAGKLNVDLLNQLEIHESFRHIIKQGLVEDPEVLRKLEDHQDEIIGPNRYGRKLSLILNRSDILSQETLIKLSQDSDIVIYNNDAMSQMTFLHKIQSMKDLQESQDKYVYEALKFGELVSSSCVIFTGLQNLYNSSKDCSSQQSESQQQQSQNLNDPEEQFFEKITEISQQNDIDFNGSVVQAYDYMSIDVHRKDPGVRKL